jgi:hypothetical protein
MFRRDGRALHRMQAVPIAYLGRQIITRSFASCPLGLSVFKERTVSHRHDLELPARTVHDDLSHDSTRRNLAHGSVQDSYPRIGRIARSGGDLRTEIRGTADAER